MTPVLPPDLPTVALRGVPARYERADAPRRAYAEWIAVRLAGGDIAVFDPDHVCPPGYFGRPCRLAVELFHPAVAPNRARATGLTPTGAADPDSPPAAAGLVLAHHRHHWTYSGPVATEEEIGGERRRVVRHVLDAPQITLRLVVDVGAGTLLAQLREATGAPPVGAWVALAGARPELLTIEPVGRIAGGGRCAGTMTAISI